MYAAEKKVLIPPDHPALIGPSGGTCYLESLPIEIQNYIASFLVFNFKSESEDAFNKRLKKYCEQVHKGERSLTVIKLCNSELGIAENGIIQKNSKHQVAQDKSCGKNSCNPIITTKELAQEQLYSIENTAEHITQIGLSANQRYLIALARNSKTIADSKILGLYVFDLITNKKRTIPFPAGIVPENITVTNQADLLSYINKGYSYTSCGNRENPHYSLTNVVSLIAVSCDGKEIAVANNNAVFIAVEEKEKWSSKVINLSIYEIDELRFSGGWPLFWYQQSKACLDFNIQGTHIGIGINADHRVAAVIHTKEIGKPICSLQNYFRKSLICAHLKSFNS